MELYVSMYVVYIESWLVMICFVVVVLFLYLLVCDVHTTYGGRMVLVLGTSLFKWDVRLIICNGVSWEVNYDVCVNKGTNVWCKVLVPICI